MLLKEKQYWKRLEKKRNLYRKREHTQKYINRETAEYINNYEIGGCPF